MSDSTNELLTLRELDILGQLAEGRSNVQISSQLDISVNTVKTHLKHIFKKLQVSNRTAAVSAYLQMKHRGDARDIVGVL